MATQKVGFIDQHIEKVALGLCAVLFVGAAVFSFGGFRFAVDGRSPADLCREAHDQAGQLADLSQSARPRKNPPNRKNPSAEEAVEGLKEWYGPTAEGLKELAQLEPHPVRSQQFPPLLSMVAGGNADDRHRLAQIVAPGVPIVSTGRSMLEIPNKLEPLEEVATTGLDSEDVRRSQRSWVIVAAQVSLVEQDVNFIERNYPRRSYTTLVKVHLQRKDETERWRDWEDVDTYQPFTLPQLGKAARQSRPLLDESHNWIARTPPPERRSGDRVELPWVPYLDAPPEMIDPQDDDPAKREREATRRASKWRKRAEKAVEGKTPSGAVDLDAALMLAKAALASGAADTEIQKTRQLLKTIVRKLPKSQRGPAREEPILPERLMPISAVDLNATVGHTYRYRMRYEVVNQYAGVPGELIDPADADRATLVSDFSPPSRPVRIESDVYFYLAKADAKREEVTVTVFKKTRLGIKGKDFKIKVGDEIGRNVKLGNKADYSTGTVCIDIDFKRTVGNKRTVALVYLDKCCGILRERLLSVDKKDKLRKELSKLHNGRRP